MGVRTDHHNAILRLLELAPPESSPMVVYNGRAPSDATGAYVLARMTTTRPDGTSITNDQDAAVTRIMLICAAGGDLIGGEADAVAVVADRAEAALLGVTPNIAGRECWPIRDEGDSPPPDWDDSTGATVWTQQVVYRFGSIPA